MTTPTQNRRPTGTPNGTAPGQPQGDRAPGVSKMQSLINALDHVELADQHDLWEFCEAMRKIHHFLSVNGAIAAGQLEAGIRAQAKADARFGVMGFSVRAAIRKVTAKLKGGASHSAEASAQYVAAWKTWEHEMQPVLEGTRKPVSAKRGFAIDFSK